MRLGGKGIKGAHGRAKLAIAVDLGCRTRKQERLAQMRQYRLANAAAVAATAKARRDGEDGWRHALKNSRWREAHREEARLYAAARYAATKAARKLPDPFLTGAGSAAHAGGGGLCAGIVLGGAGVVEDILGQLFPRIFGLAPAFSSDREWVPAAGRYLPCHVGGSPLRLLPRCQQLQQPRKRGVQASARTPRTVAKERVEVLSTETLDSVATRSTGSRTPAKGHTTSSEATAAAA